MFLQQQAMKAMIAGVDFDSVVTSLEYVRNFSIATGEDMSQKFETVMTGLARGSAQFLDDVGIQVMGSKDVVNDAVDQMRDKMGQFADTSDDLSTSIGLMKSEFENLRQELGTMLEPAMESIVESSRKLMENFGNLMKRLRTQRLEALGESIKKEEKEIEKLEAKHAKYMDKFNKTSKDKWRERAQGVDIALTVEMIALNEMQKEYDRVYNDIYGIVETNTEKVVKQEKKLTEEQKKELEKRAKLRKAALLEIEEFGLDRFGIEELHAKRHFAEMSALFADGSDQRIAIEKELNRKLAEIRLERYKASLLGPELGPEEAPKVKNLLTEQIEDESELWERADTFSEFWGRYGQIAEQGASAVSQIFSNMYSREMEDLDRATQAQIENVKASVMSEKKKAKEIEKINKEAEKKAFAIRLREWKAERNMSIAKTGLAIANALATTTPFLPNAIIAAGTAGTMGGIATGMIMANKPRFYYGSRDASGDYTEVGGNSAGDNILANIRSNEAIVPMTSENRMRLNGGIGATQTNQYSFGKIEFNVSGNVDQSVMGEFYRFVDTFDDRVQRSIEQAQYTNSANRAF